jgi:transposase
METKDLIAEDILFGENEADSDVQARFNRDGVLRVPPEPPKPPLVPSPKLTYSQDWPAYNAAKSSEDPLFKQLLLELALASQPPLKPSVGRTGYLCWEKVLSMAVKEYYKSDLRKAESILKSLAQAKVIPRVPNFRSIHNFYNDEELTPVLERLILVAALPLAAIEHTGAIDATGFSTHRYKSWNEHKWGKAAGKERVWVKLHAWAGTTTNVFVGAKITPGNVGDAPMFQEVVGNQPLYFKMADFVADKAYLSREIFKFLDELNLTPFIPFKKNSLGLPRGCWLWRRMYTLFRERPEVYMREYHRRSNIETCFHMLKARFGDHLATKNFVANQNEILTRILCHNLCVLIQEAYERGVKIDFDACLKMEPAVQK